MKRRLAALALAGLAGLSTSCSRRVEQVHAGGFDAFPEGASWPATYRFSDDLSPRERREQARDWLLAGVLKRIGCDAETVAVSLGPISIDRVPGVATGRQEGLVRSAMAPNGDVVVLLPPETEDQAFDDLAEVADRFRAHPQGAPKLLRPFEYVLEIGETYATVKTLAPRVFQTFYGDRSGYIEKPIRNAVDLQAFATAISDLTWASVDNGNSELILGGRMFKASPYRGVDLSRLAGLYKADRTRLALQSLNDNIRVFSERYGRIGYRTEEEKNARMAEAEAAWKQIESQKQAARKELGRTACGFSLDPVPLTKPQYQLARYDCPGLGGTEAGMTFFYGDLLAKLWALDFAGSFPQHILGFRSFLDITADATTHGEHSDLNHTRIWFGPREGAAVDLGKSLAMSRTATRVFGKSSVTGAEADEKDPAASAAAFIGWWNDHFEEIGVWEPEYQRFNQLIKWSFVFAWAEHVNASGQLGFLYDTPARSGLWFPVWTSEVLRDLRFQQWDKIRFYEKGHAGRSVETMEVLTSKAVDIGDERIWLSGGVQPVEPWYFDTPRRFPRPLVTGNKSSAIAQLGEDARLPLSTSYRDLGPTLEIESRFGRRETGVLRIHDTPDGLWMASQSRSQARAGLLAAELVEATDSRFDRIASFPGVARCVRLSEGQGYLVRFEGEDRWLQAPESGLLSLTPDAWLGSADALRRMQSSGERITLSPKANPLDGAKVEIHNRGPPEGAAIPFVLRGSPVEVIRDQQGGLHLPRSSLSADPDADFRALGRLASPDIGSVLERVSTGDFESAADALSAHPELSDRFGKLRDTELSASQDLLRAGKAVEAARNLERIANVFQDDPEVLGTLALALAERGELARTVDALNRAFATNGALSPEAVANLLGKLPSRTPLVDAVANALSQKLELPGEVSAFQAPTGLGFRVSLRDNVSFQTLTKVSDGAPYYIAPGRFNAEWMPPLNYSLETLPAVRIPEGLLQLRPMVISSPRGGPLVWRDLSRPKQ